jgi:phage terminase Nu1 subunit (DNA packaging protein)
MPKLFMVQLGGRPKGRLIEQHDMFFGVADELVELIPAINEHWPEVNNKWHVDSYRAVTRVGGYRIDWLATAKSDSPNENQAEDVTNLKLFFINLGGYLPGDFEEYHHKLLIVAPTQAEAIKQAKQSDFYKKYSFKDKDTPFNAASHIDDKHQVDVDEIYNVSELLSAGRLQITEDKADTAAIEDKAYIGYLSIKNLRKLQ